MDIEGFLKSKGSIVTEMYYMRPQTIFSDVWDNIVSFVLLVYAKDSPLAEKADYAMLKSKCAFCDGYLKIDSDAFGHAEKKAMSELVDTFLTRYQSSFEYEQLVTAHIVFMDNSRELRKSFTFIMEEDKRLKASEIKGKLIEMNKVLISDIKMYTKAIYGENEDLGKKSNESIRIGMEAMKGLKKNADIGTPSNPL